MILRCLPPAALAASLADLEGSGAAAKEVSLPINMILNQLPSGKVEMTLQELVPHIPAGYLKPVEALAPHLATLVNLPLMDVVMRIPPDLLALRPDQKDVDSSVVNMADPFSEEVLREQAEARRQGQIASQPNIIDEHQVPATEEFVPRDKAPATTTRSFIPPPRPISGGSIAKTSGVGLGVSSPGGLANPPLPAGARTAALPTLVRNSSPVPPPAPNTSSRRISPSGRLPAPIRAGSPLPMRPQGAPTTPVPLPPHLAEEESTGTPKAPPFPGADGRPTQPMPMPVARIAPTGPSPQTPQPPLRPTMPIPLPPAPAETAVGGTPPPLPLAESKDSTPQVSAAPVAETEPAGKTAAIPTAFPQPGQPDASADELQRLAALAMVQLEGEEDEAAVTDAPAKAASSSLPASPSTESPEAKTPELPAAPSVETPGTNRSIPASVLSALSVPTSPAPTESKVEEKPATAEPAVALNLNSCTTADLLKIPGCSPTLAEAIVSHRTKIGWFKRIEDLLDVPGMNGSAYRSLTGEAPPSSGIPQSLSELLGFPEDQKVTLKDVTDRICCWPDVTGCILGQSTGLSLVGTVPKNFDKAAIVAFAPRMFESINKSFGEIAGKETNELIIPTTGTSFHILRNGDLYLIILSRLPQMPDRHVKIARLVLSGLNQLPV